MNCQTRDVSGINVNCLTNVGRFVRRDTEAGQLTGLGTDVQDGSKCRDYAEMLRRMLMDREGILDMLVKGRGSG